MAPFDFTTHSLRTSPFGESVQHVLQAALQAVEPAVVVGRALQRSGDLLFLEGLPYDLKEYNRVFLIGAGKAGEPMAQAASQILGERLAAGMIIVKEGYASGLDHPQVTVLEAGHPVPDERGVRATRRIVDMLKPAGADDLVICLLSGGGSALLVSPAGELSLEDLQELTSHLLASGATINEINTLRKHLDQVKGGNLARLASPASLITLILSDVIGDPLDVIASGPTVPDPTTFGDAQAVLEKYGLLEKVSPAVRDHIQRGLEGQVPETPKPGDPLFERVVTSIIGNSRLAVEAALTQAQMEGFNTLLLTTYLQGEARQVGRVLAAIARQIAASGQPVARPACLVAGGETTVTIQGDGLGGRNQEVALGAVADLDGLQGIALVTLATDGGDGPTDAAGAVVTGETMQRARQLELDPADFLRRSDAYHFFEQLDDLLKPGPTRTNVNDLTCLFLPDTP